MNFLMWWWTFPTVSSFVNLSFFVQCILDCLILINWLCFVSVKCDCFIGGLSLIRSLVKTWCWMKNSCWLSRESSKASTLRRPLTLMNLTLIISPMRRWFIQSRGDLLINGALFHHLQKKTRWNYFLLIFTIWQKPIIHMFFIMA